MAKSYASQLAKTKLYLDELDALLEERTRLTDVLNLAPSQQENSDLIASLGRINSSLQYLHTDLSKENGQQEAIEKFNKYVDEYSEKLAQMEKDPYVSIQEYAFTDKVDATNKKLVRFSDYDTDGEELRSQLMGTASNYKPYRDDDVEEENEGMDSDRNTLASVNSTNHELFAAQQQRMVEQDQSLDALHDLVRIQHNMGLGIHDELDEHLLVLNDLENGVDRSTSRLLRATNRVVRFRAMARENGSLVTIVVLTVILILLLVVLN